MFLIFRSIGATSVSNGSSPSAFKFETPGGRTTPAELASCILQERALPGHGYQLATAGGASRFAGTSTLATVMLMVARLVPDPSVNAFGVMSPDKLTASPAVKPSSVALRNKSHR